MLSLLQLLRSLLWLDAVSRCLRNMVVLSSLSSGF